MLAIDCVIALCLLVALLTGSMVTWLLKRISARDVRREASRWTQQIQASNYHIATLQASVEEHIQKARSKEVEASEAHSARQALEQDMERLRKRLTASEKALSDAVREGERIASIATAMKTSLDTREHELGAANVKIKELEPLSTQLIERDAKLLESETAHANTIKEMDAELVTLRSVLLESESLSGALRERDAALRDLQDRIALLTQEKDLLGPQVESLRGENTTLQTSLRGRETDLQNLRARIDALMDQRHDDQAVFEAHLAELDTLSVNLRQAQTKVQAMENMLQQVDEKEGELQLAKARIEELEPIPAQLADRTAQVKALEVRLQESLQEKENGMGALRQRILFLEGELSRISQEKSLMIEHLRSRVEELEPMSLRLAELAAKHQELDDRHQWLVNEKDAEIDRLRKRGDELEPLGGTLAERDARLRDMEHLLLRTTEEREVEIRRLRGRVGELESLDAALQERDQRLQELEADHRRAVAEHDAAVARLQSLLQRDAPATVPFQARPSAAAAVRVRKDDLKLIYGVGPALERMLNKLGIYTFQEVALWTEKDIDRLDAQLKRFHGRIRREGWVASAKEEHFKKYGERL